MEDSRAGDQDRSEVLQGQIVEERYGYYRRCQRFRRNGQQCKAPAMKGADRCYKHQEQADIERRRREQFTLPSLVDLKTVQRTIWNVAQALLENRIDEDYAGELLQKLESASIRLRPVGGVGDHSTVAFLVNDLALL
ncbi:MAG TPA: hypothetical protein VGH51_16605 [Candidatus Angelobacter sp.]|jgi:hypothetical protein